MSFPWKAWLRAFREASPHRPRWVHLGTGEVKWSEDEGIFDDESWVEVPWAESDDEFQQMREFSASPEAGKGSRDLLIALADPKPFRAFRAALKKHPAVADVWHDSRWAEAEERMRAFCEALEVADLPQSDIRRKPASASKPTRS